MFGSRLLLMLLLAGMVVAGHADSPADMFGFGSSNVTRFTGRLDGDPDSTVEVKVGRIIQIDVIPCPETPATTVTGRWAWARSRLEAFHVRYLTAAGPVSTWLGNITSS